jgi:hypothetical protein
MSEASLKTNRSHADEVRARRQQSSQAHQGRASQHARQPVRSTPPVVSRRRVSSAAVPNYKRVGSRTRRSFSISIDGGAELVLGSLPNVQIGWRTVSGIVAATLVILILIFTNSSMFRVSTPEVVGVTQISISDISAVINLANKPIYLIDPQIVAAQVTQSFPQLMNVKVSVGLPASVVISAQERQPVLAWEYNGPVVWIDSEGFIFESTGDISGLPIVHADDLPPYAEVKAPVDEESLIAASPLAPTVRKMDTGLMQAAMQIGSNVPSGSDVIFSSQEGFGWNDPGGWRVYIGTDLSNLELKLIVYKAINQTLIERGITPTMISVAQPDAPFYRVE